MPLTHSLAVALIWLVSDARSVFAAIKGHAHRVRDAVLAMGDSGAAPDPPREAYTMLWHGMSENLLQHPSFITMSVLVASIRRVDPRRTVIIQVLNERVARDRHLQRLAQAYAPVRFVQVPLRKGWEMANYKCQSQVNERFTILMSNVRNKSAALAHALGRTESEVVGWAAGPNPLSSKFMSDLRHKAEHAKQWQALLALSETLLMKPELGEHAHTPSQTPVEPCTTLHHPPQPHRASAPRPVYHTWCVACSSMCFAQSSRSQLVQQPKGLRKDCASSGSAGDPLQDGGLQPDGTHGTYMCMYMARLTVCVLARAHVESHARTP